MREGLIKKCLELKKELDDLNKKRNKIDYRLCKFMNRLQWYEKEEFFKRGK